MFLVRKMAADIIRDSNLQEPFPRYVRFEPREIISLSICPAYVQERLLVATLDKVPFKKEKELAVHRLIQETNIPTKNNLITSQIKSPWWIHEGKEKLFWINYQGFKRAVRLDFRSDGDIFREVTYIPYIEVKTKHNGIQYYFPEPRQFDAIRSMIEGMMNTDKPVWIKI